MTTTAAACVAPVTNAGCCVLTTGAGTCGCVLTCPDPPACAVWDIEGRFKSTLDTNSLAERLFWVYSTSTPLHQAACHQQGAQQSACQMCDVLLNIPSFIWLISNALLQSLNEVVNSSVQRGCDEDFGVVSSKSTWDNYCGS
uniref:Secreted protein n=1 Tax=Romanomermis culicivorax TaxID=13658 RepID=A0A915JUF2_ROMCU